MIALTLVVLAGLLLIGVAVEHARRAMDAAAHRHYEATSHARLLRELRRHQ